MKKILIIRFSSIGDIVLTTPVIRCLKHQFPKTEIHFLTKKSFKSILENNPFLTKVHSFEKKTLEVSKGLRDQKFDFVVDLHNNLRSMQVRQKLARPSVVLTKLNIKKFMLVKFKVDMMPDLSVVDRYMETVEKIGVKNDDKGLDFFIPEKDEVLLSSLPLTHQKGYIGFVIGAKHYTKQLPIEKIITICKKINTPIILLGGKEDAKRADEIEKAVGNMVYNACGKYSLNQSASLVKQATKIISHDTGLMHIAAAFKKQIVSIWGNTVPSFGFFPYMPGEGSEIVEAKNLPCRTCSKIGYNKCPKGHFKCMMEIDINKICLLLEK